MAFLELLNYQFFINAILAAVLASISCGIIGTYIVSRRIVFISGGISHASFGGIGIGHYLGINPIFSAAVFAIISALTIERLSEKSEIRPDTLIGIMWSFGMAVGIIFIFITPGYAANLMSYLFGNIITVSQNEIYVMMGLTVIIILVFISLFKEILYVSFDQNYARTQGVPVALINYLLIALIALTIVVTIRIVGIILVIALLTIPQTAANLITKNFRKIIFYSIVFGFLSSIIGLIVSVKLEIPSGASIIFFSIMIFVITKLAKKIYIKIKLN